MKQSDFDAILSAVKRVVDNGLDTINKAIDTRFKAHQDSIDQFKEMTGLRVDKQFAELKSDLLKPAITFEAKSERILEEVQATIKSIVIPEPVQPESLDQDAVVSEVLAAVEDKLPSLIPAPVKGDKGDDGHGEPGKDGVAPSAQDVAAAVITSDFFKAFITKTIQDNIPEPAKAKDGLPGKKGDDGKPGPAPSDMQVIEAVRHIYPDIRKDILAALPRIEHKGIHVPNEEYDVGSEVIKNDSTYRAMVVTSETPPHDDWQCVAKSKVGRKGDPGDDGKPGKKGDDGKPGRGIDDIILTDEKSLVITLTDGEAFNFDLSPITEGTDDD